MCFALLKGNEENVTLKKKRKECNVRRKKSVWVSMIMRMLECNVKGDCILKVRDIWDYVKLIRIIQVMKVERLILHSKEEINVAL